MTDHTTATLPADMPAASDPQMVVSIGSVTITGDIMALDSEPLLIVSGCHIVIDSPCIFSALTVGDPDSAPQACDSSALDPLVYDPNSGRRTDISLENVIVVAAGGVWAEGLTQPSPVPCPDPLIPGSGYEAPDLRITGSVITGYAGATSLLFDCDGDVPIVNGTEAIVAGWERLSSLPADTEQWATADIEQWATADIAWWPGRDQGIWRRR